MNAQLLLYITMNKRLYRNIIMHAQHIAKIYLWFSRNQCNPFSKSSFGFYIQQIVTLHLYMQIELCSSIDTMFLSMLIWSAHHSTTTTATYIEFIKSSRYSTYIYNTNGNWHKLKPPIHKLLFYKRKRYVKRDTANDWIDNY